MSDDDKSVKEVALLPRWKTAVKGLIVWDDDSDGEVDEEVDKEEGDPKEYAFTCTRLGLGNLDDNTNSCKSREGIVGEQEVDSSGLTDSGSDQRRLIDELYAQEGAYNFPDSDDEAESEQQAKPAVEESKVLTRSESKKKGINPPPANKAEYPPECICKSRSASPKAKSPKEEEWEPKHPFTDPKNNRKKKEVVSVDMLGGEIESQPQSEPSSLSNEVYSPEQTTPKVTFATILATNPKAQVPPKTKPDAKKILPAKGENKSAKPIRDNKGKVNSKQKGKGYTHYTPQGKEIVMTRDADGYPVYHSDASYPLTMDQKVAAIDGQITFKAKQAKKPDSPVRLQI